MSAFGDKFKAERSKQGSGGTFKHNGKSYSTNVAGETGSSGSKNKSIGSKIMGGIKSAGAQIKSDFQHGTNKDFGTPASRAAYDARTAASRERIKNDPLHSQSNKSEGAADQRAAAAAEDVVAPAETFAANKKRYDDYMAQQKEDAATKARMGRATSMYERQNRGAGPVPRQMQGIGQFRNPYMPPMRGGQPVEYRQRQQTQPFQGSGYPQEQVARRPGGYNDRMPMMYDDRIMPQRRPQNQATSPAFRYAAQNYDRLGGQQRMYDRPMEMMSQRERQGVRDVRDDMDRFRQQGQQGQQGQKQGIASLIQNIMSNKGGGRTAPQPQMPRYQTMRPQEFSGGSPTQSFGGKGAAPTQNQPQQSDFGRMLAARFGGGNNGGNNGGFSGF